MDYTEVEVDYHFHSHIIGKGGTNGKIPQWMEWFLDLCIQYPGWGLSMKTVWRLVNECNAFACYAHKLSALFVIS